MLRLLLKLKLTIIATVFSLSVFCNQKVDLIDVQSRELASNAIELQLTFSEALKMPTGFAIDSPAKILVDLENVNVNIPDSKKSEKINLGVMKGYDFIETEDKTRVVIDVLNIVPYEIKSNNNIVTILLSGDATPIKSTKINDSIITQVQDFDFRRGESGEGRVILDLTDDGTAVDFRQDGNDIIVDFKSTTASEKLLRKYDVSDFGTPIKKVIIDKANGDVRVNIQTEGLFEKIAYQLEDKFIVEARPITQAEKDATDAENFEYKGERISLNFQEIEVRSVLQVLADFTGLNIIASDTVEGSVTLKLNDVPWDQALEFILKSKGLGKRLSGNVILIAPNEELALREQNELEAKQQAENLAVLRSEFITINYAKAADMVAMLKDENNSILSARGQISSDERTNSLLVKDTEDKLEEIRNIVARLDKPVRQVLIEAQIVEATDDFNDALGIEMSTAARPRIDKYRIGIGPTKELARTFTGSRTDLTTNATDLNYSGTSVGTFGSTLGKLGLAIANLPGGTLLDLELQAFEAETKANIISRPKLMTLDQKKATIETGKEVAFETTANGGTTTTFKKAVVKLEVTPQITPNGKITMELSLSKDSVGEQTSTGESTIDTTNMTTNVLVDNGETIVLGGVFTLDQQTIKNKVPVFGDIPVIGKLFRSGTSRNNKNEILIFVTPKIVSPFERS